jgi:hypothetical protein
MSPEQAQQRWDLERELQSLAVIERKVMVPMRDGKRMAADIYRPKDASKTYPTVFVRTPYNFNFWDVRNGVPRAMTSELDAVKRGYAIVTMNERGHFFSEGNYDILGPPLTDGSSPRSFRRGSARAWGAWARTTSRATGTGVARSRCCSSPGSSASRTRRGPCFRRAPPRQT